MYKVRKIDVATLIPPLRQGSLDSLCGMYAVINAIRLTHAASNPLNRRDEKHLFHAGVRFLNSKHDLEDACIEGMVGRIQVRLAKHLIAHANERMNTKYKFHRLAVKKATYASIIEGEVDAGRPVCVLLDGALGHYSVIVGYSESRFILFDSEGLAWIQRDLCQLSGCKGEARHVIEKSALFGFV